MKKTFSQIMQLWQDQRGALTTVEVIGYTVLIGGAVALVGFGITTMGRGKISDVTNAIKNINACDKLVDEGGDSGYFAEVTSGGTDTATGIVTEINPTK
jgi:hypothetical protein